MTIIREIRPEEIPVLDDFLYEAIFIPEGIPAPPRSIIGNEDLQVYVRDFGKKADDRTPSLAISLYKEYRGRGIGTEMLRRMLELLRTEGYRQVSLSVQKGNFALRMYRNAGFRTVEDRGDELLMTYYLK